jgi:hypothetical protein
MAFRPQGRRSEDSYCRPLGQRITSREFDTGKLVTDDSGHFPIQSYDVEDLPERPLAVVPVTS